jgi:hypothetical protein
MSRSANVKNKERVQNLVPESHGMPSLKRLIHRLWDNIKIYNILGSHGAGYEESLFWDSVVRRKSCSVSEENVTSILRSEE